MKTLFYLDRMFGDSIFLTVENGIVISVSGGTSIENKMREEYVGKEISFVKKDIEKRLYKVWVKNIDHTNIKKKITSVDSRIHFIFEKIHDKKFKNSTVLNLDDSNKNIERLELEKKVYIKELEELEKMLKDVHRYEC